MFASNPGHTCSRLRRKDEAESKDAFHAPKTPPALEPRGRLRHRGGLLNLLAGTLCNHLACGVSALFGSAFGAEAALSMRARCPTSPSTRAPILPLSAQYRCFRLHGRETAWQFLALQFFRKPPPNVCLLVTAGVAFGCQMGHPLHLASWPLAGVSSGYRFGVSFWWPVVFWKAALFDNCLTSALRSLREALERAKCSPAVCLRPKKGDLSNIRLGQQEGKTAGYPQNT